MSVLELAQLARLMRTAQKDYFRNHDREVLQRSKDLERRFDAAVRDLLEPPGLFPDDEKGRAQ